MIFKGRGIKLANSLPLSNVLFSYFLLQIQTQFTPLM